MDALEHKVRTDGLVISEKILKVDGFLNHQLDPRLMFQIGEAFYQQFQNAGITRILTVEASGIAPALMTAWHLEVPCIFAKKKQPNTLTDSGYQTEVHSFTKGKTNTITLSREFLQADDQVLIIDDFLAHGHAALGLNRLVEQAGATTAGVGIVIEKSFQNGRQNLKQAGLAVHSLCRIASLAKNQVTLLDN